MKYFSVLALAVMVFLAGCTEGDDVLDGPVDRDDGHETSRGGTASSSEYIGVRLEDFPSSLEVGEETQFSLIVEAKEDLESVEILMYDFGTYIGSSCNGRNRIGDLLEGEIKTRTCTLKVVGTPSDDLFQEMKFEANFKVKSVETEVSVKVYDSIEYDRISPSESSDYSNLGSFGEITVSPKNAKEGNPLNFELSFDDGSLIENSLCNCHIEKLTINIPSGFLVNGLEAWTKKSCDNGNCYSLSNIKAPFEKTFFIRISGVTRSNEFYIKTLAEGIWGYLTGSKSFTILSAQESE